MCVFFSSRATSTNFIYKYPPYVRPCYNSLLLGALVKALKIYHIVDHGGFFLIRKYILKSFIFGVLQLYIKFEHRIVSDYDNALTFREVHYKNNLNRFFYHSNMTDTFKRKTYYFVGFFNLISIHSFFACAETDQMNLNRLFIDSLLSLDWIEAC